ncbi:hypothetical protein GCM10023115_01170 [Pontixanthobacter gangjinensis]|uniref:Cyclic nucleotide-binding domain-containing protein n=1 Tax=Pontixanthobacter gangjinensis TaxID=1028742 RepID=A0A6I4SIF1_9SPHN|nr:Crp/Fnr family transcriptional regulator [Pontixanthobacter gangjinensis]MXO55373.1 cyclic nucleotide-binding domain-containing protein [Pontixanthobacter gangjinensis]
MTREERTEIVKAIFDCDADMAQQLMVALRFVEADHASTIAFQGDPSRACQFVVSGAIGLHALGSEGQYTQISTIEPGEVFGAYPKDDVHAVEAIAQSAVEMLVIGTAQLRELALSNAAIASGLAGLYASQLANVLGRLAARVTLTAKGRVFSELRARTSPDGRIAPVPVVSALAVQAQTSRETASRAISELERRGVMQRQEGFWQISSTRMLEDMVL